MSQKKYSGSKTSRPNNKIPIRKNTSGSKTAKAEISKSKTAKAETSKSKTAKAETSKYKTVKPESSKSKTSKTESSKSKTAKSESSKSKTSKSESSKSKTTENWKPFPNKFLKDKYQVSNRGNVQNKQTGYVVKLTLKNGYYYFNTIINGKMAAFRVNRLVAILFVPNPDKSINDSVNHIDGDKLNNDYQNLEWTTVGGNNQHAADNKLTGVTKRRVGQYAGELLFEEYDSLTAASNATGIHMSRIVEVCKGMKEEFGGFAFEYLDNNPNEQIIDPKADGFKNIKTFPNYWVNDKGEVYSKPFKKFMKLNKHSSGCLQIQLTKPNPEGKGQIKRTVLVHNLVAIYFLPKRNKKEFNCVHHKDGDKTNNNIENLDWKYVRGIKPNFNI